MKYNDFLPIRSYDHIEFYVGNAKQMLSQEWRFQPLPVQATA
jgi:hypothetical protein